MIGTGMAVLGLLGAGATAWGANKAASTQADAARQAAGIQAKGQADALDFQKGVYGNQLESYGATKGNMTPFINNGIDASNTLSKGMGGDLSAFYNSPDYQFALKGGSQALDNSAAAKGGMISGNQMRAQTEYGSGLATQNLQSYFQRLSGMAGQGIQAGGYLGQVGATLGNGVVGANASANILGSNNQAQSVMGAGTAEAAGTKGMVTAINGTGGPNGGGLLNSLSLYNQMSKSSFQPSGSNYNGNQIGGLY